MGLSELYRLKQWKGQAVRKEFQPPGRDPKMMRTQLKMHAIKLAHAAGTLLK